MSKVKELFTYPSFLSETDWIEVTNAKNCRYSGKQCFKVRKSNPDIIIGTCTVSNGRVPKDIIICPNRLLERKQIFTDCLHLLQSHTPGNELHIVPEVPIPGGNVDFFLVSADSSRKVKDFVGIELQTLDTTGSVWPELQELLAELNLPHEETDYKPFGMNWKMTAKTILVQLLHKIDTFEHLNRHLVLVIQDCLMDYMKSEFNFDHVKGAKLGDSMHFHSYSLNRLENKYKLVLENRYSTDSQGVAKLLGMKGSANVDFVEIAKTLESKMSDETIFQIA